jgi:hypothetical protein
MGVMQLLRPLLLDTVPSVQQSAAIALGRLANYNDELAAAVVSGDILPQLVYSLGEQNVCRFSSCLFFYPCFCGGKWVFFLHQKMRFLLLLLVAIL